MCISSPPPCEKKPSELNTPANYESCEALKTSRLSRHEDIYAVQRIAGQLIKKLERQPSEHSLIYQFFTKMATASTKELLRVSQALSR